jgi:hypothetical protein
MGPITKGRSKGLTGRLHRACPEMFFKKNRQLVKKLQGRLGFINFFGF